MNENGTVTSAPDSPPSNFPALDFLPPGSPPLPSPSLFTASDGYRHAWRLWETSGRPRGLIIALHGIQSHSGWYGWSADQLARRGYLVAYLDRRGSGQNEVARGDAPHAERLLNDVVQFTQFLRRQGWDDLPRFLLGVSWGGKLATYAATRYPDLFQGVILQAPGLRPRIRARFWQRWLISAASQSNRREHRIDIPLDDPQLFADRPEFQDFVARDPLALRQVTVRFLQASGQIDRELKGHRSRTGLVSWSTPMLLMLAGKDQIIDNERTQIALVLRQPRAISSIVYPEACHTLEFSQQRERILVDMLGWLHAAIESYSC